MARLRTDFRVSAYLARLEAAGIYATVIRRGDPQAGAVEVKVARLDGRATLYGRIYGPEGESLWEPVGGVEAPEADVDARISRRLAQDRDLWTIEVDSRDGRHFLDSDAP